MNNMTFNTMSIDTLEMDNSFSNDRKKQMQLLREYTLHLVLEPFTNSPHLFAHQQQILQQLHLDQYVHLPICASVDDRVETYSKIFQLCERITSETSSLSVLLENDQETTVLVQLLLEHCLLKDFTSNRPSLSMGAFRIISIFCSDHPLVNLFTEQQMYAFLETLLELFLSGNLNFCTLVCWFIQFQNISVVFPQLFKKYIRRLVEGIAEALQRFGREQAYLEYHSLCALRQLSCSSSCRMRESFPIWFKIVVANCFSDKEKFREESREILRLTNITAYCETNTINFDTSWIEHYGIQLLHGQTSQTCSASSTDACVNSPSSLLFIWSLFIYLIGPRLFTSSSDRSSGNSLFKRMMDIWKLLYHSRIDGARFLTIRRWKAVINVVCRYRNSPQHERNILFILSPLVTCLTSKSTLVSTRVECIRIWGVFVKQLFKICDGARIKWFKHCWNPISLVFDNNDCRMKEQLIVELLEISKLMQGSIDEYFGNLCDMKGVAWNSFQPYSISLLVEKYDKLSFSILLEYVCLHLGKEKDMYIEVDSEDVLLKTCFRTSPDMFTALFDSFLSTGESLLIGRFLVIVLSSFKSCLINSFHYCYYLKDVLEREPSFPDSIFHQTAQLFTSLFRHLPPEDVNQFTANVCIPFLEICIHRSMDGEFLTSLLREWSLHPDSQSILQEFIFFQGLQKHPVFTPYSTDQTISPSLAPTLTSPLDRLHYILQLTNDLQLPAVDEFTMPLIDAKKTLDTSRSIRRLLDTYEGALLEYSGAFPEVHVPLPNNRNIQTG